MFYHNSKEKFSVLLAAHFLDLWLEEGGFHWGFLFLFCVCVSWCFWAVDSFARIWAEAKANLTPHCVVSQVPRSLASWPSLSPFGILLGLCDV